MASRELSILVVAKNLASGALQAVRNDLKGIESQAGRSSVAANTLSGRALGGLKSAASGASGAFGVLKGRIGQLAGTAGLVGLGAGLFSVVGFLGESISTAKSFGDEVYKLQAVTGLSAQKTSELAGAFHHFGIESDTALKLAGFAEKNLFKYAGTAKAATKFQEQYGLALRDSSGRIKDFNTLLLDSADYFNSGASASQKAAAMAALYGRSWRDLIPVLKAGRQGIAGAEEEAKKLGLTLTGQNIGQLTKLREATRSWGTALGGLKLQIGLAAVPAITELAKSLTHFLATSEGGTTGTQKIVGFFKDILNFAQQAGSAFTHYFVPAFQGVLAAFNTIPKPLRDLLLTGFAVNKSVKFLFGFSPLKLLEGGIGALFKGGIFARGAPGNPMWVQSVGGGVPGVGGGVPGVGGPNIVGTLLKTAIGTAAIALGHEVQTGAIKLVDPHAQFGPASGSQVNQLAGAGAQVAGGAFAGAAIGEQLAGLPGKIAGAIIGTLAGGGVAAATQVGIAGSQIKAGATFEVNVVKDATAGGTIAELSKTRAGLQAALNQDVGNPLDGILKFVAVNPVLADQLRDVNTRLGAARAQAAAQHVLAAQTLAADNRHDGANAARLATLGASVRASAARQTAATQALQPHLRRIEGADLATSTKVGTLRTAVNSTTSATRALQPHLRNIAGADARTAISTGIISRKNFAPRVNVNVNAQVALSVNSVARSLTDMHISSGPGGTGGFIQ